MDALPRCEPLKSHDGIAHAIAFEDKLIQCSIEVHRDWPPDDAEPKYCNSAPA
jgi:hypothetical protein